MDIQLFLIPHHGKFEETSGEQLMHHHPYIFRWIDQPGSQTRVEIVFDTDEQSCR